MAPTPEPPATKMTDTRSRKTRRPVEPDRSSPRLPAGSETSTRPDQDDVVALREALRSRRSRHRGYLAELRQGDVDPVEDWSTWYAEYLLGLR